jgi:hypothetical protein
MHILKGALSSNAASLGLNWIYNMPYLEKLAHKEPIMFIPIDPAKFKRAGKAVNGYPGAKVGDFSLQGNILKWLYDSLKKTPDFTPEAYKTLLIDYLKPGGPYKGWVESYGRKLIYNALISDLEVDAPSLTLNDGQLVGFVPYIAMKTLKKDPSQAWIFASVLTSNESFKKLFTFFDIIFDSLNAKSLQKAIEKAIEDAPESYKQVFQKAVNTKDIKIFIKDNDLNTACSITHAVPLIVHILYNTKSFEDAVHLNTKIGGASSDRGLLLGAVLSEAYGVPDAFIQKTNF